MFLELKQSKRASNKRKNSDVAFESWNSLKFRSSRRKSNASATLVERVCAATLTFILFRNHSMCCLLSLFPARSPSSSWSVWSLTTKSHLTNPVGDLMTSSDAKLFLTNFNMWAGSSRTWTRELASHGWGKYGIMFSGSSPAPSSFIIVRWADGPSAVKHTPWAPASEIFCKAILAKFARSGPQRPAFVKIKKISFGYFCHTNSHNL